jgi:hypothetical protein
MVSSRVAVGDHGQFGSTSSWVVRGVQGLDFQGLDSVPTLLSGAYDELLSTIRICCDVCVDVV